MTYRNFDAVYFGRARGPGFVGYDNYRREYVADTEYPDWPGEVWERQAYGLVRMFPQLFTGKILEIGSAFGFFVQDLLARGFDIRGIDSSEYCIEHKVTDAVTLGDAMNLSRYANNEFQLVFMKNLLSTFPDTDLPTIAQGVRRIGRHVLIVEADAADLPTRVPGHDRIASAYNFKTPAEWAQIFTTATIVNSLDYPWLLQ